jgi:hypothetical protein
VIVLVPSHKTYSDCWKPFSALFRIHWPDCQHERYIFSSRPDDMSDVPDDFPVKWRDDKNWCLNLLEELREVSSRHQVALVAQEDFFICSPVRDEEVTSLAEWLPDSGFDEVRLYPCPGSEGREIREGIGVIDLGEPYRVSLQAGLWRIPAMIELLEKVLTHSAGSPRDFELIGGRYADHMHFCGARRENKDKWVFTYHSTAVVQGVWLRGALDLCKLHNIPVKPGRAIRD